MNYRHAFHAGNFADIFKHLVLTRLLLALRRRDAPFRVIDTHAGAGLYDLSGEEARRSPEWRDGAARFDAAQMSPPAEELAKPFRGILDAVRAAHGNDAYPGSPLIAQRLLRAGDRMIASEAHGETATRLRAVLGRDRRTKVLMQDGFVTLNAAIPPLERRGLVLIDPAFESPDEFSLAARGLIAAWRKWPTGIFALWHPVKEAAIVENLVGALRDAGIEKALRLELQVDAAAARGLNACGLVIVNPPFMLDREMAVLLPELTNLLARGKAGCRCDALAPDAPAMPTDPPRAAGKRVKPS